MKIYGYSFRNIACFPNVPTIIPFEAPAAQMNMMIGENGIGKSTVIKVLKLGLYHDLAYADVKVDEIANDVNTHGEIVVELNSRGKDWTIVTNFSPNKIKVYEGRGDARMPEPLDRGGMPETKKFIRDQVLDIPFYIFDNILSIDVSEFKSLLTLNTEDTRKIRDRIFGFSIFNDMSSDIKKKLNIYVDQRKMADYDLQQYSEQLTTIANDIKTLQSQIHGELKIDELKAKVDDVKKAKASKIMSHQSLSDELAQVNNDYRFYENREYKASIAFLTQDKLAANRQIVDIDIRQSDIDTQIDQIQKYSEVVTLTKKVADDKQKFIKQTGELARLKTDYSNLAGELALVSEQHDIVSEHIHKKIMENKHIEYRKLKDEHLDLNKWMDAQNDNAKKLGDESVELQTQISSMKRELAARKNGQCPECNTKFDAAPDHQKHIGSLVEKIEEAENQHESKQAAMSKLLKELVAKRALVQSAASRMAVLKSELSNEKLGFVMLDEIDGAVDWSTRYIGQDAEGDKKMLADKVTNIKARANQIKNDGTMLRGQLTTFKEQILNDGTKLKSLSGQFTAPVEGNIDALRELRTSIITKRTELQKLENSYDVQIQVIDSKIHGDAKEPKFSQDEAEQKLGELPKEIDRLRAEADQLDRELFECEKSIELASNAANLDLQSAHLRRQQDGLVIKIEDIKKKLGDLKIAIERQEHLLEIIKRSKDEVLRTNIPYINHMVVNTCKTIGVTQMLTFDDSFTPHILRGNRQVSLMSASLGQRKKMNFAVLISITKFLKMRYGGINIIFYDEMFSSIDEKGRPHMLNIIKQEIVENLGMHVWITNHFFIPNAPFDNYIIIEGKNGFSSARMVEAGELLSLDQFTEHKIPTEVLTSQLA